MDAGGIIKVDSCAIAKSLLWCEASQEHEDHAFLCKGDVEGVCSGTPRESGGISMIKSMRRKYCSLYYYT